MPRGLNDLSSVGGPGMVGPVVCRDFPGALLRVFLTRTRFVFGWDRRRDQNG